MLFLLMANIFSHEYIFMVAKCQDLCEFADNECNMILHCDVLRISGLS